MAQDMNPEIKLPLHDEVEAGSDGTGPAVLEDFHIWKHKDEIYHHNCRYKVKEAACSLSQHKRMI